MPLTLKEGEGEMEGVRVGDTENEGVNEGVDEGVWLDKGEMVIEKDGVTVSEEAEVPVEVGVIERVLEREGEGEGVELGVVEVIEVKEE